MGSVHIRAKLLIIILLIAAGIIAYHYVSRRKPGPATETAYVLPPSVAVVDAPADIRLAVESVKAGDQVQVLLRSHDWAKVKLADGRTGWVESKNLVDAQAYDASQKLLKDLAGIPAQAEGHAPQSINLRFEPSRDSTSLTQLPNNQKLEIFGRRIVERPSQPDRPSSPPVKEAWYLVRADSRAGWVLGRFVSVDLPEALGAYAQGYNIVAWVVLNTVPDEGREIPQYLTADRTGNQDVDFTHIRVFTWWAKNHRYVTAYAESGLRGYFPIRAASIGNVPQFRLNLLDENGKKIQKVYGLFSTITRPLGIRRRLGEQCNADSASPAPAPRPRAASPLVSHQASLPLSMSGERAGGGSKSSESTSDGRSGVTRNYSARSGRGRFGILQVLAGSSAIVGSSDSP